MIVAWNAIPNFASVNPFLLLERLNGTMILTAFCVAIYRRILFPTFCLYNVLCGCFSPTICLYNVLCGCLTCLEGNGCSCLCCAYPSWLIGGKSFRDVCPKWSTQVITINIVGSYLTFFLWSTFLSGRRCGYFYRTWICRNWNCSGRKGCGRKNW